MIEPFYDVIVVGAGPAGSVAARRAAEAGLTTLLIEKRQEIGAPVRCAEAIGAELSRSFLPADPRWIDARISAFAVVNSHGTSARFPPAEPTLVVNRKVFDVELARRAAQAGALVVSSAEALGLIINGSLVCGVRINHLGRIIDVRSSLVVAADGAESQVARWAGLHNDPPISDYGVGVEFFLGGLAGKIDPAVCEYHLNRALAPGGYLWVFPKGEDTANVGLVASADQRLEKPAVDLLEQFVGRRCPGASILSVIAGGIPMTGAGADLAADGIMLVGDAAHQADPLTGGGINLGMIGAEMAIQVAVPAIQSGDLSARRLNEYTLRWNQRFGKMHASLKSVRKILDRLDPDRLDRLIERAAALPMDQMTLAEIMLTLFKNDVRLLWEVRTLIATGLIMK